MKGGRTIEPVYQWIAAIIVFVALLGFTDVLTPSRQWRPYVKLTLGGMLLYTFLTPLTQLGGSVSIPDFEQFRLEAAEKETEYNAKIDGMNREQQSYIWREVARELQRTGQPVLEAVSGGGEMADVTVIPEDATVQRFSGMIEVTVTGADPQTKSGLVKALASEWEVSADVIDLRIIGE